MMNSEPVSGLASQFSAMRRTGLTIMSIALMSPYSCDRHHEGARRRDGQANPKKPRGSSMKKYLLSASMLALASAAPAGAATAAEEGGRGTTPLTGIREDSDDSGRLPGPVEDSDSDK